LPVESYVAPSTPATGQLWLDISTVPAIPKKYNGSAWIVTQFVKLGQFTRSAGVIGTPISYALSGKFRGEIIVNASITYPVNCNIGSHYKLYTSIYNLTGIVGSELSATEEYFLSDGISGNLGNGVLPKIQSGNNVVNICGPSSNIVFHSLSTGNYATGGTVKVICERSFLV